MTCQLRAHLLSAVLRAAQGALLAETADVPVGGGLSALAQLGANAVNGSNVAPLRRLAAALAFEVLDITHKPVPATQPAGAGAGAAAAAVPANAEGASARRAASGGRVTVPLPALTGLALEASTQPPMVALVATLRKSLWSYTHARLGRDEQHACAAAEAAAGEGTYEAFVVRLNAAPQGSIVLLVKMAQRAAAWNAEDVAARLRLPGRSLSEVSDGLPVGQPCAGRLHGGEVEKEDDDEAEVLALARQRGIGEEPGEGGEEEEEDAPVYRDDDDEEAQGPSPAAAPLEHPYPLSGIKGYFPNMPAIGPSYKNERRHIRIDNTSAPRIFGSGVTDLDALLRREFRKGKEELGNSVVTNGVSLNIGLYRHKVHAHHLPRAGWRPDGGDLVAQRALRQSQRVVGCDPGCISLATTYEQLANGCARINVLSRVAYLDSSHQARHVARIGNWTEKLRKPGGTYEQLRRVTPRTGDVEAFLEYVFVAEAERPAIMAVVMRPCVARQLFAVRRARQQARDRFFERTFAGNLADGTAGVPATCAYGSAKFRGGASTPTAALFASAAKAACARPGGAAVYVSENCSTKCHRVCGAVMDIVYVNALSAREQALEAADVARAAADEAAGLRLLPRARAAPVPGAWRELHGLRHCPDCKAFVSRDANAAAAICDSGLAIAAGGSLWFMAHGRLQGNERQPGRYNLGPSLGRTNRGPS